MLGCTLSPVLKNTCQVRISAEHLERFRQALAAFEGTLPGHNLLHEFLGVGGKLYMMCIFDAISGLFNLDIY